MQPSASAEREVDPEIGSWPEALEANSYMI